MEEVFDFEHINLIPKKCIVDSRSECDTSVQFGKHTFKLPIIPANMECVINEEIAENLAKNGYFYVYHRFGIDNIDFIRKMKAKELISSISIGVNQDSYELLDKLRYAYLIPDYITIDIAHGHSVKMERMIKYIRSFELLKDVFIIAGNVCTPEAVKDLSEWGANAIKAGIAPGCFKAGTRVLMSNGIYKNIEEINIGDFVINKDGEPVKTLNVMNQGFKHVMRIKNNLHYTDTFVTKDHQFFIGDLSTSSSKSISSSGIAKLLDKQAKTVPKYKWKEVGNCDWDNTLALFPKNIKWNLPENFTIDLNETLIKGVCEENKIITNGGKSPVIFNRYLHSSYELGYIFGTFLGNGSTKIEVNKINNTECGNISWSFDEYKTEICEKLCKCIKTVLDIDINYELNKDKNVNVIYLYNKCFTKILYDFGKRTNKHLPEKYYCKNKEYIQGLFDGLLNSDGHICKNQRYKNTIYNFTNTSIQLIELFQWCCINLELSFTSNKHNTLNPKGGLNDLSENPIFNDAYRIKTHTMNRFTQNYLYSNILDFDMKTELVETWDIEVDCPTHSFVANNMIVHNSSCLTYMATGFGSRGNQASMIQECAKVKPEGIYLIADGGIREVGDVAKCITLGADMAMAGSMFSGLVDSPGNIVSTPDGKSYKEYWGSASEHQSGKSNRIEGTKKLIPLQNKTFLQQMHFIQESLQSSISYGGGKTLQALKTVKYILKKL
jgi:IMP dehydrogenase/GMP reductase